MGQLQASMMVAFIAQSGAVGGDESDTPLQVSTAAKAAKATTVFRDMGDLRDGWLGTSCGKDDKIRFERKKLPKSYRPARLGATSIFLKARGGKAILAPLAFVPEIPPGPEPAP